ncbi:MAG: pirin family protein, partial [Yaniella sp.]|nr:pirin family protein [Yaniella sp.]
MTVQRTIPQRARSLIGAWCFLDYFGPDDVMQSGGMQVPRHPHTGLATVSWLFEGRVDHVDSAGNWALVRPGEVNLMSAGYGITHSEYSSADTTRLHGVQLWYAFPEKHRFVAPHLDQHRAATVRGPGWEAKVAIGSLLGVTSPVETYSPLSAAE